MAYVSTETTKRVRGELKQAYPNLKFSVSKKDGTLRVRIMSGDIDFRDIWEDIPQSKQYWKRFNYPKPHFEGYVDINTYHPDSYNPKYTDLFKGIIDIMKGDEWFDKSEPQIDYFNTAYYMKLSVGKWNKDYQYTGVPRMSDLFGRMRAEELEAETKMHPDWCSNCGMKDDGCINLGYGDWYCMNFLNNRETYDGRYDKFRGEEEDKLRLLRFNNYFEEEVYRLSPDIYAEVFDKIDYNHKQLKEAYTNPSYYFSMKGSQDRMKQFQSKVRRIDENIYQRAMETAQMRIAKEEEDFEAEIYDRQGNLRTVDDNFIEATNNKLQALHRLLEANRKQILATNNEDTKTRLRTERYQIQDAIARLREFIDDPINHEGGDFMVRLGAEEFGAEGEVECYDCQKLFDLSETKTWIDDERYCADCLDFQRKQALKDDEALQREEENERIARAIRRDRGDEYYAEGEDITLKDSAKLGFGLGAGLLGFRVALFGASALVGGFILNRNK